MQSFPKVFCSFTIAVDFSALSSGLLGATVVKELVWHAEALLEVNVRLFLCSPGSVFGLPPCPATPSPCHRGLDIGLAGLFHLQNDQPPEGPLPSYQWQLQDLGEEAGVHRVLLRVRGWDQVLQQADDLRVLGLGTSFQLHRRPDGLAGLLPGLWL